MVRYAVRKFVGIVICILTPIALSFFLLQTSYIQTLLLNSVIGDEYEIKISKLRGIFPFEFSIDSFLILSPNKTILTEGLSVKLKKSLAGIKLLSANKILINDKIPSNFSFSDIQSFLPFIGQKFLKNINIKNIKINNLEIDNINCITDKKTNLKNINFVLNKKKINASYKFNDDILYTNVFIDDLRSIIKYNINNNCLNIRLFGTNNNEINFDGMILGNALDGVVTIPKIKSRVAVSIKTTGDSVDSDFYCKDFGVSGNLSYDMKNKRIFANGIMLENGIVVKPFFINENFQVESIDVLLKKGKIRISDINLSPNAFYSGNITFEKVDISQFADKNLKIAGILEGAANFSNGVENLKLSIKNPMFSDIKLPDMLINGIYSKEKVNITVSYKALDKINNMTAQISANDWIITKNSKIKGSANGIFNFSNYDKDKAFGCVLNYSLNINGNLNNPIVSGNLNLKNGVYINRYSGTYLKDGSLYAEIKNNKLMIKKIHMIDDFSNPGNISGSGEIYFDGKDFLVNVESNFENFCAVDIAEFEGRLFGKVSIKGSSSKGIKISGDLYSNDAKFDVSNIITKSSMALELVEEKKELSKEIRKEIPFQIPVDINFSFKPYLKIVGYGVNSKWEGGAKLSGDLNNLKYDAKIILTEGKIKVSGNEFKLSSGTIWSNSNNPGAFMADVSATKSVGGMKVAARFIQNENDCGVKFSSKPYLSEKDILSYLLFNHSSNDITTGEGLALFSVMSTLSGNESLDIMSKIKSVLRIDSIDVKRKKDSEKGEYDAFNIGKKIGKMKISIEQGGVKDTAKAVLDAKITKNSKVSVDIYGKNTPGVGIFWNKRY